MADLITSDRPLSDREHLTLHALLDTLLPASEDGRMPSAADSEFLAHLQRSDAAFIPSLHAVLAHFDEGFAELPLVDRCAVVERYSVADRAGFNALLLRVYDCYYQQDRVREAIGVVRGAPFPQGNVVTPGDLSLLDPVLRDSERHRYRQA